MKNHIMVEGRLLQTNKRFSDLREKQKMRIAEWSYEIYRAFFLEHGRPPRKNEDIDLLWDLQRRIDDAEIWIPGGEVVRFYYHRKNKLLKRLKKELPERFTEPAGRNGRNTKLNTGVPLSVGSHDKAINKK